MDEVDELKQKKDKYYQQTLDDEIQINNLLEEIQQIKQDRNVENITRLSLENRCLEQENKELKAYKDINEDFKQAWYELNEKYKQLRSTLEEINKIAEPRFVNGLNEEADLCNLAMDRIQNKINEVLSV